MNSDRVVLNLERVADGADGEVLIDGGEDVEGGGRRLRTPWLETGHRRRPCRAGLGTVAQATPKG